MKDAEILLSDIIRKLEEISYCRFKMEATFDTKTGVLLEIKIKSTRERMRDDRKRIRKNGNEMP